MHDHLLCYCKDWMAVILLRNSRNALALSLLYLFRVTKFMKDLSLRIGLTNRFPFRLNE